jgi:glycosyltransferase involved in cell wall biosynthesis
MALNDAVVVIAFNAKLTEGCDYATQTMHILGRSNYVYGLLLGEPVSWRDVFSSRPVILIERRFGSMLIHPFFVIPGQRFGWIKRLNYRLNAFCIRSFLTLKHPVRRKILWFFEPYQMMPIFRVFSSYTSVYDCIDFYKEYGKEWYDNEELLLRDASLVVCISSALAHRHNKKRGDIQIVPQGFSLHAFAKKRRTKKKPLQFSVGYIGGLNYRLDFTLLLGLIQKLTDVQFIIAGPIQHNLIPNEGNVSEKLDQLFSLPNVTYLGDVPKTRLTELLLTFHASIIPYDLAYDFNRYCYPMKTMELFWFGVPVVATPIESFRKLEPYILLGSSASDFINLLRSIRAHGWPLSNMRAQKAIAQSNSWEAKVSAITRLL